MTNLNLSYKKDVSSWYGRDFGVTSSLEKISNTISVSYLLSFYFRNILLSFSFPVWRKAVDIFSLLLDTKYRQIERNTIHLDFQITCDDYKADCESVWWKLHWPDDKGDEKSKQGNLVQSSHHCLPEIICWCDFISLDIKGISG